MPKIEVRRLSDALGAEIIGAHVAADMTDADFKTIENALHDHLVVVIRGQDSSPLDYVAFSKRFGKPEPHGIGQFHHEASPDIVILSNRRNEQGGNIGLANVGAYFHSDYSYLAVPSRCTMLYAIEMPGGESGTTFANQRKAYDELIEATRQRIDQLVCRHRYGNRDLAEEVVRAAASKLGGAHSQKEALDWVRHPLVRSHPHTGARSLYAVSGTSFGIEGMDDHAGLALLNELRTHSTQPKYCYRPTYRPGDIVIWDNCSLLHSAPLVDPSQPRTLWRITVKETAATM